MDKFIHFVHGTVVSVAETLMPDLKVYTNFISNYIY